MVLTDSSANGFSCKQFTHRLHDRLPLPVTAAPHGRLALLRIHRGCHPSP